MREHIQALRAFLSRSVALTKEDKVWKAWLDLKQQEWRDLVALIGSNVRDEFKMRAIAILLVPHYKFLPFVWPETGSLTNLLFLHERPIKVAELPENLRQFTADLILQYVALARQISDDDDIHSSLSVYDRYILDFLKILPEDSETAAALFGAYELNDPVVFCNMDDSSGYNPLYPILNEEIPEKWKKLAAEKMHKIIKAEIAGKSKPRADFEIALKCYLYTLQLPLSGRDGGIRYSVELFASQLEFVLGLPTEAIRDQELFQSFHVGDILKTIVGDQYQGLRHRFARYVVLENTAEYRQFNVYDPGTKRAAQAMLAEFGSDEELAASLKANLARANKRSGEDAQAKAKQGEKERNVLGQMV